MTTSIQAVMAEQERYRAIWHRTYAPLRRAIAGAWAKREGDGRFLLELDAHGGYGLTCYDTRTFATGRYTVVAHNGGHFLVLDEEGGDKSGLRIQEVGQWHLVLRWDDDASKTLDLIRRSEAA